jgi:flagellar hook-associated protein 1
VDTSGLGHDTTLAGLAAAIDNIEGISASVTSDNRLAIASDSTDVEFAFGGDTSGALAALGVNTFFTGTTAHDLGVNADLQGDPTKFAASRGGIGADTANAVDLAAFLDRPLASRAGATITQLYDAMQNGVTQGSAQAKATAIAASTFESSLRAQSTSISGVNLDEEAVQMMQYQRAYQASAKFITTINELFDVLVQI